MNINNPPSGYAAQLAWAVAAIQQLARQLNGVAAGGGGGGGSIPGINNFRQLLDPSNVISEDWNLRRLIDSANNRSLDWENHTLFDASSVPSEDWDARVLLDASNVQSVNWKGRKLYNGSNVNSLDWQGCQLLDPSNGSGAFSWDNQRRIDDTGGNLSIEANLRQLYDLNGYMAIKYSNLGGGDLLLGDIDNNITNTILRIDPSTEQIKMSSQSSTTFWMDRANSFYALGDVDGTANGNAIYVDDLANVFNVISDLNVLRTGFFNGDVGFGDGHTLAFSMTGAPGQVAGVATLVGGVVTINTTAIGQNDIVLVTVRNPVYGGPVVNPVYNVPQASINPGSDFRIFSTDSATNSTNNNDNSEVNWFLIHKS